MSKNEKLERKMRKDALIKSCPGWREVFKDYKFMNELGEGSFGTVVRAKDR